MKVVNDDRVSTKLWTNKNENVSIIRLGGPLYDGSYRREIVQTLGELCRKTKTVIVRGDSPRVNWDKVSEDLSYYAGSVTTLIGDEGVFRVGKKDKSSESITITGVDGKPIFDLLDSGVLPVVRPYGLNGRDIYRLSPDLASAELAIALNTKMVVFMIGRGEHMPNEMAIAIRVVSHFAEAIVSTDAEDLSSLVRAF